MARRGSCCQHSSICFVGAPIFYFAYSEEVKHFLGYKTTATGEEVSLVDAPSNPAMVYAPIIEIVRLPEIFKRYARARGRICRISVPFLPSEGCNEHREGGILQGNV